MDITQYRPLQTASYDPDADFDALAKLYCPDLTPDEEDKDWADEADSVWSSLRNIQQHSKDQTMSNEQLWYAANALDKKAIDCYEDHEYHDNYSTESNYLHPHIFRFFRTKWVSRTLKRWLITLLVNTAVEMGVGHLRQPLRIQFLLVESDVRLIRTHYLEGQIASTKTVNRLTKELETLYENARDEAAGILWIHRRDNLNSTDMEFLRWRESNSPMRRSISYWFAKHVEGIAIQWRNDLDVIMHFVRRRPELENPPPPKRARNDRDSR